MTQRVFDMENEQDVKDLFDILPDWVDGFRLVNEVSGVVEFYGKGATSYKPEFIRILSIHWGTLDHVARPVDKSKWIGYLCRFWDDAPDLYSLGILKKADMDTTNPFLTQNGSRWKNCRPVKREEIKFVEDIEE